MKSTILLYPMFTHIAWVAFLYVLLTVVRAPAVWGIGKSKKASWVKELWAEMEPRIGANLSNQFEWPLFFHVACVLLITQANIVEPAQVWLAWIFIAGRLIHSFVQILTANVRLRGLVFTINFIAVLAMWFFFAF